MKRLPFTNDNVNYGAYMEASPFSIRRLITRRVSSSEAAEYFDLHK